MNDKRAEKLNSQLIAAEKTLRIQLVRVLPVAVHSGVDYFTNSEFNPYNLRLEHLVSEAEDFLQLAKEALSIRDQLNLPKEGSVGNLYLKACSEAADLSNEHRRGPRKLALWVAGELGSV
jgi:hypothetical protein